MQGAVFDEGIDEDEDARGGDVGHLFGDEGACAGGSAPIDHARAFAVAVFLDAVELILTAAAGFHACAGLLGGEALGEELAVNFGEGWIDEDGFAVVAVDGALDETEGEAGGELELVEGVEAAALGDDKHGDVGGGAGGGVKEVGLGLASEGVECAKLADGDG